MFTCDFGYNLKGPSSKTCDEFGIWQPRESVDCIVVECPSPDNLANGLIYTTNGNRFGSVITYTCNRGFAAVPFSSQTCTGNGFWKPIGVASCRAK
ncbi:CSMD3-like protein, partial [Mya arenaria]